MTPRDIERMALEQANNDVWAALHLLAREVIAQMNTGYHRTVNQKTMNLKPKEPAPL